MRNENVLILELCKFIQPDKAKIEELMGQAIHWPYVLGQLLFHRMGGAAYYTLRECGLLGWVNREVRNSLKTVYDSGKAKSESLKTALAGLAGILQNADFSCALLDLSRRTANLQRLGYFNRTKGYIQAGKLAEIGGICAGKYPKR